MAKKSKIHANLRRQNTVERYRELRAQLKRDSVNPHLSPEDRAAAMSALHRLPRDASPVRVRNRDAIDGRPRGYLRKFGLSRVNLRRAAHQGRLPGITKSSW